MQARYYDPQVGRFLAIDPVGYQPGQPMTFNRHSYANNNPYKYVDPDGKIVEYVGSHITSKEEIKEVFSNLKNTSNVGKKYVGMLENSKEVWLVRGGTTSYMNVMDPVAATSGKGTGGFITINMRSTDVVSTTDGNKPISQEEAALHEAVHGVDASNGKLDHSIDPESGNPVKEDRAMEVENKYREEQALDGRRIKYPNR